MTTAAIAQKADTISTETSPVEVIYNGIHRLGHNQADRDFAHQSMFCDTRREPVFRLIQERLNSRGTTILNQLAYNRNELRSISLFLSNKGFTTEELIYNCTKLTSPDEVKDADLFSFIDGSIMTYLQKNSNEKLKESIGTISGKHVGFHLVDSLVYNRDKGIFHGAGDIVLHSQPFTKNKDSAAIATTKTEVDTQTVVEPNITTPSKPKDSAAIATTKTEVDTQTVVEPNITTPSKPKDSMPITTTKSEVDTQTVVEQNVDTPSKFNDATRTKNKTAAYKEGVKRRNKLPWESKESYSFKQCAEGSLAQLVSARRVTTVIDRAGDDYKLIQYLLSFRNSCLIIRSKTDRKTVVKVNGKYKKVSAVLAEQTPTRIKINIPKLDHKTGPGGKKRKKREARLGDFELRYCTVKIKAPSGAESDADGFIELRYVEVMEIPSSVPDGEKAIHWILMTNWEVNNVEDAIEVVEGYRLRWLKEDQYRNAKTEGFDIENSEIDNELALKRLAIMALTSAIMSHELVKVRDGIMNVPITKLFDEQEIEVLQILNESLEGNTEKQKNPHKPDQLAFAYWVIARLGGWKPFNSKGLAGVMCVRWGLNRFFDMMVGHKLTYKNSP
jgi:hypothetical protein